MATPKQEDPLQVLTHVFNEVLIQTGKHVANNPVGSGNTLRAKAADSMTAYHYALDDLESEITRAKAVILRDLEKLRAARAPAPAPAPTPVPAPQPVAPPAPMMDLPSSAAHTMTAPAFAPKQESKTVAPFPDMGMGMSSDVVDLTASDIKQSPRVSASVIKPPPRLNYSMKTETKPSPKQASKATPKLSQIPPTKVTPVPPPQIPRFQPPPQPAAQSQQSTPILQTRAAPAAPAAQVPRDTTSNATSVGANAAGGNALHFTDMQFSLAPSTTDAPGAPPAPMPEFDQATFAPQDNSSDMMSLDSRPQNNNNARTASTSAAAAPQQQQPKEQDSTADTNLDDLFNLDTNSDEMDSMFDLGGGVNTFNDMFFDNNTNNDDDMQFDEQFFLQ
ncbi:hypothetical protein GGR53DRAFT_505601 [Hypoxylon sp. FL1150]|nr:hypothetical protein GGR53DRAFT_505601 [Hypoxylon sp. FL1150]